MAEEKTVLEGDKPATKDHPTHPVQPARPAMREAAAEAVTDEAVMKVRKQAGSIAEVIEPVTSTRRERTN